ncbi:MAG: gliding motility-associated C-terminal domain-containing protein, partial [Saprospiraceae bacterium]|nr:gliding motility-associated C-terminal domain-containing protein [Saprospiraceae bacterium]
YLYSINNSPPLPYTSFPQLGEGNYNILMQDIKGCQDEIDVNLVDPPPVTVNAGDDITVSLGESTPLIAIGSPASEVVAYNWTADSTLTCLDCPDPTAFPLGSTVYEVTVINDEGCISTDRVTVIVRDDRPIYIPNAISPNGDGRNDQFFIYGNAAALNISELRIFNRWGALVYEALDVPLGEYPNGWDGTFNGETLNPDVFAFYAIIQFIDNKEILYEGDITIIR